MVHFDRSRVCLQLVIRVGQHFEVGSTVSPGVPCGHSGCLSHISHCEGCGRIHGRGFGWFRPRSPAHHNFRILQE